MVAAPTSTVVGAGEEVAAPSLVPVEPVQGAGGPRVVQACTGSALYVRDGWTVEMLRPEPVLEAAEPGDTWEALRLSSPLGQHTCSLYVALTEEDQPSLDRVQPHIKPRPIAMPRWDFSGARPTLLYPDPARRLAPAKAWSDADWDVWTRSCHPRLAHEVLQVWTCGHVFESEEPWPMSPSGVARVITPEPKLADAWGTTRPAGQMLQPRLGFTTTPLPDGRILVAGGSFGTSLASAEVWDPLDQTFRPAGEMRHPRTNHTAIAQPDGGVLIVGGTGRHGANIKDAELWDPLTATFAPAGTLRVPRDSTATVTAFPDGSALVVGGGRLGVRGRGVLRAEMWDPNTQRFEEAGRLDRARRGHRAFALPDGDAIVAGPGTREWLRWDARRRAFQPAGQTAARRREVYALGSGRLLAVGVTDASTCKPGKAYTATSDAEVWSTRHGRFRSAGAFRSPRYEATVTALPDGGALFYGGGIATCMDVARYRSAELWDPGTRTFRGAGRTELPHWDESTALLPDGRVAVIGGIGTDDYSCGDAVLGSIEVWDPATRAFSMAGALGHPRSEAAAITLGDGSVLILGGVDGLGSPVVQAEQWVPPVPG